MDDVLKNTVLNILRSDVPPDFPAIFPVQRSDVLAVRRTVSSTRDRHFVPYWRDAGEQSHQFGLAAGARFGKHGAHL